MSQGGSPAEPSVGELYLETQERIVAFVRSLPAEDVARPVPACPGWTVHDVVAHLCGVTDDALAQRWEGAPGPVWTGAQVERGRGVPTDELLDRWVAQAPGLAPGMQDARIVLDMTTHEQDLYGALGIVGPRDARSTRWAMACMGVTSYDAFRAVFGRRSPAQIAALGLPEERVVFGPRESDLVE